MSKALAVDIGYFPRWLWLLLEEENGGKKEQLKYLVKRTEQSVVGLVRMARRLPVKPRAASVIPR